MSTNDWMAQGHSRAELRSQLRDGRLEQPRRGMVVPGDGVGHERQHRRRILAAQSCLGPDTVFSHTSAAVLHGLPLLAKRHRETTVVRTGGGHGNINPTLHARRAELGDGDREIVDGLPVTSLTRTVADLVKWLPFPEAVMIADAALARGLDRGDLLALTASGRGCRMASRALLFADGRAESPGESFSRVRIAQAGLPAPELQHEFWQSGVLVGRSDFWWVDFGVIGEFDGEVKYGRLLEPGQRLADVLMAEKRREQRLHDLGPDVIRWTWPEMWSGEFVERLRRAFTRATSRATHAV